MRSLLDVWPLFGLSLGTPRLELRPVRDEDIPGLVEAALAGVHDPNAMPFAVPWTEAPPEKLTRDMARHQWALRSGVTPADWTINFAILHEGVPIGVQDMSAKDFGTCRTVSTGSWLSIPHQRRGLGKEMRAAVLLFAFDQLGAEVALTDAIEWNEASIGVSRALGYADNGVARSALRPGEPREIRAFRLTPELFIRPAWHLRISGYGEACRDLLGASCA